MAPKAKIIPVKALDDSGEGDLNWIVNGIYWVIENSKRYNTKIISMSLGFPEDVREMKQALIAAKKNKIITVSKHQTYGGKTPLTNLDEAFEHMEGWTLDLGKKGADNVYGIGLPVLTSEVFRALHL